MVVPLGRAYRVSKARQLTKNKEIIQNNMVYGLGRMEAMDEESGGRQCNGKEVKSVARLI